MYGVLTWRSYKYPNKRYTFVATNLHLALMVSEMVECISDYYDLSRTVRRLH